MKKLYFTPKNVINCVDNEPALWDPEFTDVHHWLSFLEAYSAIRILYVCILLFNPCGVILFLHGR